MIIEKKSLFMLQAHKVRNVDVVEAEVVAGPVVPQHAVQVVQAAGEVAVHSTMLTLVLRPTSSYLWSSSTYINRVLTVIPRSQQSWLIFSVMIEADDSHIHLTQYL